MKIAEAYAETLKGDDPRFKRSVHVLHGDGSFFLFKNAFVLSWRDRSFVFTEHNQYHVFHTEDLTRIHQYVEIEPEDFP